MRLILVPIQESDQMNAAYTTAEECGGNFEELLYLCSSLNLLPLGITLVNF